MGTLGSAVSDDSMLLCAVSALCLVPIMQPAFQETKVSLSHFDYLCVTITQNKVMQNIVICLQQSNQYRALWGKKKSD